jgi:predicted AlkP superfamily phosphohydrolase/phosphomutase
MRDIDREVGGYEIDVPVTNPAQMRGGERAYLAQVERLHMKCLEAAKMLIRNYQPDVFMMTLQGVDLVHHDFWRYMDNQDSPFRNVVQDWYVKMDGAVGELARFADSSTYTLVLSDHGSAPVSTSFFINKYLAAKGLLITKNHAKHKGEAYTRLRGWVLRTLPPETIARIYKSTPNFISHKLTLSGTIERILLNLVNNIDWERTRAFSTGGHQAHIYVNTDSSELENSGEANRLQVVRDIIRLMSELSHPLTGKKITPVFHFKEDCFHGPYEKEAPDVCVELYSGEEKVQINPRLGSEELWNSAPHFSSVHTREGFWGICGPGISQGRSMDVKLVDLAPTLLGLLGLRTDTDFDGRPLLEIAAVRNN